MIEELEQEARLMRARMERLQAERDELLAALHGVIAKYQQGKRPGWGESTPEMIRARRIIDRVEGRA